MRTKQNVVIVNWKDRVHPETGGAEVYCESIAHELVELGFRVTLLTSRPHGAPRKSVVDGYAVRRGGSTYTVYLFALFWLFLHRRRVDAVIDSQNGIPFFTPLAVRRATPVVLLIHHVHQQQFALYFGPLMTRVGQWLESAGSRFVYRDRAVAAVSPSSRAEIRKQLGLTGPIHVVPNGSTPPSVPFEVRRASVPTITCVGRLVPHKRWQLVVEAARELRTELPDLRLHLVGTGSELAKLRELCTQYDLDDTVTVHGFVAEDMRDTLLAEAWLTVSASVGEGWGLSIIEAAAVGVPAVALDVPGLRDSIRDGETGWLTTESELAATVRAALTALDEPATADAYATRCKAWAATLTWRNSAERYHAIFADEAFRDGNGTLSRAMTDISTIVSLDPETARAIDLSALRPTDEATFCPACVGTAAGPYKILLHGRDELEATHFLAGVGLDLREQRLALDTCGTTRLLTWHGDGVKHNFVSTVSGQRCPRPSATPARRHRVRHR